MMSLHQYCFVGIFGKFCLDNKRYIHIKVESLNNDVYVTWYSSIKCYHLNIINGRLRSMCFKYCKNYYISCALSWKVKKKHGQLWQKIPWNWTRVYCMNFLSKLLSYPFVSWNNMNVLWRLRMNAKDMSALTFFVYIWTEKYWIIEAALH